MRIGVAGAGAVGCHYASLLAQAGCPVACLAHGAHLQAMHEHGLLHVSDGRERRVALVADDSPAVLADADVVLLTCKMTALSSLLGTVRPHLKPGALVATVQNGVQAPAMAAEALPDHAIAAASAFIGVRIERPGVVVHSAAGGFRAGMYACRGRGAATRLDELLQAMRWAGVETRRQDDVACMLWRKMLWNCGFNALTALTCRYAREIALDPGTRGIALAAMRETLHVARNLGIDLAEADIERHLRVTGEMGPVKTSMWQDIERGRPTEVDYMNGHVAERAAEMGVEAPVNRLLTALMHAREHGDALTACGGFGRKRALLG